MFLQHYLLTTISNISLQDQERQVTKNGHDFKMTQRWQALSRTVLSTGTATFKLDNVCLRWRVYMPLGRVCVCKVQCRLPLSQFSTAVFNNLWTNQKKERKKKKAMIVALSKSKACKKTPVEYFKRMQKSTEIFCTRSCPHNNHGLPPTRT